MDLSKVRILINESNWERVKSFFEDETCLKVENSTLTFRHAKTEFYYAYMNGTRCLWWSCNPSDKTPSTNYTFLNDELKAEIKKQFPKAEKVEMDKDKYLEILAENEELRKDLTAANSDWEILNDKHLGSLMENDELQKKNNQLKTEVADLVCQNTNLENSCNSKLEEELSKQATIIEELGNHADCCNREFEELSINHNGLKSKIETLKTQLKEQLSVSEELESQVVSLSFSCDRYLIKLDIAETKIEALRQRIGLYRKLKLPTSSLATQAHLIEDLERIMEEDPDYKINGEDKSYLLVEIHDLKEEVARLKKSIKLYATGISKMRAVTLSELVAQAYQDAKDNGWWDEERNDGELIALMHSELSEALEALRKPERKDEHLPELDAVGLELADCCIRIFDYCGFKQLNLQELITKKMEYNKTRARKHGKKF